MHSSPGIPVPKPSKRVKTPSRPPTGNAYRDRAISQEDTVAARLTRDTGIPYERVRGSGAFAEHPGDVRPNRTVRLVTHRWLAELKDKAVTSSRGKRTLSIDLDWLVQIMQQAESERCLPALVYQFTDTEQLWVITRYEDFARLLAEHKAMSDMADV